jgi:hypothetical protein
LKKIIDEELVRKAIAFALPTVRELVAANTWGPTGVVIAVGWQGLPEPIVHVMDELGQEDLWEERWGKGCNFREIALQKLSTALHGGNSSRSVVANHPWVLEEGDSFYTGASAEDGYLAVSASGAYGDTDETVSWIVWNIILLLCQRRIADLQSKEINCL